MSLDVQKRLFALALDRLADREPINELLEITLNENRSVQGSVMTFRPQDEFALIVARNCAAISASGHICERGCRL